MAALAIAFAASLLAGPSMGIIAASAGWVQGVRPRQFLRECRPLLRRCAFGFASMGLVLGAVGVAEADRLQAALGSTCAAAAFLVAIATWLLLVEPEDEGDEPNGLDEPKWWPQFEADLADWTRQTRIPVGPRL